MNILILGLPLPYEEDGWKDHVYHACLLNGWKAEHWPARGVRTDDVIRHCQLYGINVVIWARTHGHDPFGDSMEMLNRLRAMGVVTIGMHLDLYWGLHVRERRVRSHPFFRCQYVFTADGGTNAMWQKLGINHHWCPPAMTERFLADALIAESEEPEYSFVGGYVPTIHGKHRKMLLSWAANRYGRSFRHWGVGKAKVTGTALNALYGRSWVTLGDSAPSPFYWSDRVPRTLGRGGVLAYPDTPGLAECGFTAETMMIYERFHFDTLGEMIDASTANSRKTMRENALTVIRERHTWETRMQEIMEEVFG